MVGEEIGFEVIARKETIPEKEQQIEGSHTLQRGKTKKPDNFHHQASSIFYSICSLF